MYPEYDVDAELTAWYEVNAEDLIKRHTEEDFKHRCSIEHSPCPVCEDRQAREDYIEYFDQ